MHPLFKKKVYTKEEINNKLDELAIKINQNYKKYNSVVCIGLLKGCLPFMSDLCKRLKFNINMHYAEIKSYYGIKQTTSKPSIHKFFNEEEIYNKHCLIVDEICDTGHTLKIIKDYLLSLGALSVKTVVLIYRDIDENKDKIELDWYGWKMGDGFLVGYGLDYMNYLRNLPYIGIINKDKLEKWTWDYNEDHYDDEEEEK